jgi:hypothetical protein
MINKKTVEELAEANGKRKIRIVQDLKALILRAEQSLKNSNILKKHYKYITYESYCDVPRAYKWYAHYTHYCFNFTKDGKVKNMHFSTRTAKSVPNGNSYSGYLVISTKDLEAITNLDLSNASQKVVNSLNKAVFNGEI